MENKTYTVKANRTATDVVNGNVEVLETGYSLEEAKLVAIIYQRDFRYMVVWIEEEPKGSPTPHNINIRFESYTEMMMWVWTEAHLISCEIEWEAMTLADNLRGDNPRYIVVGRVS